MANPGYKAKYLNAKAQAQTWKDRAEAQRNEVQRLKRILAPHGFPAIRTAQQMQGLSGPLYLGRLAYECILAELEGQSRVLESPWENVGPSLAYALRWRDQPVHREDTP